MLRTTFFALLSALGSAALAPAAFAYDGLSTAYVTPPRLSLVNGPVSLWRPGQQAWAGAALNTPLAEGDTLATSDRANVEVQVGAQAWVRAANATEISITANRPEVTALTVAAGVASVDVRAIPAGRTLDIITPHAIIAIGIPGYYRITTNADITRVAVRRGGNAQLRSPSGLIWRVQAGEEALLDRLDPATLQLLALPAEDQWDHWNIGRGDWLGNSIGAPHVSPEVYWLAEPDRHGSWIQLGGTWAWATGPRVSRPAYAPPLVERQVNSRQVFVSPRHDERRFEARTEFGRPVGGQATQPHNPASHDMRPRSAASMANLPAPVPRALPPAPSVAVTSTPVAAPPPRIVAPPMPVATPPTPVAAQPIPPAVNRESPVRAIDGPRERERHGAGGHHQERRVEAAAPAPRPAATANAGPAQVRRSDESAPAAQGPRREGTRPEGADRKPRP